jgi:hypothetical protein
MAYAFCPMGNIFAVSASDGRRERGEGRRRWDPRERGTRETRPTPRLRTNFEVSIQLGVPLGYGGKAKEADVR